MAPVLEESFTRQEYASLPAQFRATDSDGDLYAFLRLTGDYAGGVDLVVAVMEGDGFIRPITLSDGSIITLGSWLTVDNATIDPSTGGCVLPLDEAVTFLDLADSDVLVAVSPDWILTDVATVPSKWLPYLAQAVGVDLRPVPVGRWREWLADPVSRLPGTLRCLEGAIGWHLEPATSPLIVQTSRWELSVTVPGTAITTSSDDLLATASWYAPCGTGITLTVT